MVANKLQINFVLLYLRLAPIAPASEVDEVFLSKISGCNLFKDVYRRYSEKCARCGMDVLLNTLFFIDIHMDTIECC